MIDRKKVIKGLKCCCDTGMCFHGCPYHNASKKITECTSQLALEALDLLKEQWEQIKNRDESLEKAREEIKWLRGMLKEQEARVMTLEEVKAFVWDYCYLEEERLPGKEYRMVCGDYALTCITWPCVASMSIQHGDESYGRKWRCWSSKPTDEQREAVKWE